MRATKTEGKKKVNKRDFLWEYVIRKKKGWTFMQNISEMAMIVMALFKKRNVEKNGFITTYQLSEEKELMSIPEEDRREAIKELLMENFLSYKTGQLILTEKGYNFLYSENGKRIGS